jgi:hypothetical protein
MRSLLKEPQASKKCLGIDHVAIPLGTFRLAKAFLIDAAAVHHGLTSSFDLNQRAFRIIHQHTKGKTKRGEQRANAVLRVLRVSA